MTRRFGWYVLPVVFTLGLPLASSPLRGEGDEAGLKNNIVVENDIVYGKGGDTELKLNLARPDHSQGLLPAIICIHGGGWRYGNRKDYQGEMERLARHGYVAATITYRLSEPDPSGKPRNPFPAQIEDVKCAIRWMRANAEKYHVDPNRIGVTGGSAGGHLSLLAGVTGNSSEFEGNGGHPGISSRVQAVVNYFGPTDMPRLYGTSKRVSALVASLLDGPPEKEPALYKAASPVNYVSKDDPPILTIHGTADPAVPVDQATEFDAAMKKAGASHTLLLLEGEGHGFSKKGNKTAADATTRFFDEHLKNKS